MVSFLPPDLSLTFLVAAILPLIIGFIVGLIIKSVLKIGILIAVIVLALIFLGIVSPDQVLTPLVSLFRSGSSLAGQVERLAGYLPYSSITFIIGLALGFWKG
ncbi:MAG: hypothetical protein HY247_01980 [archaeon]|nr:MAG: hypothetical protein HY247_01980 [archaeon]